jgi:hypothetical protein
MKMSEAGENSDKKTLDNIFESWASGEDLRELNPFLQILVQKKDGVSKEMLQDNWRVAEHLERATPLIKILRDKSAGVGWGDLGFVGVEILDYAALVLFADFVNVKTEHINSAIASAFKTKSKLKWRCPKCSHYMDSFERRRSKKLENLLFGEIKPRHCKKCRKESWPFLKSGRIRFEQVTRLEFSDLQNYLDGVDF